MKTMTYFHLVLRYAWVWSLGTLLLLSACTAGEGTAMVTTTPITTLVAATVAPTTTPTLAATDTPAAPEPTAAPTAVEPTVVVSPASLQPIQITNVRMMSPDVGWATGGNEGANVGRILRTNDGGAWWQDVTPAQVATEDILHAYFMDEANAWFVAYSDAAHSVFAVYATGDGGQSWQLSSVATEPYAAPFNIAFSDPMHGWMMVGLGAAAGSKAVDVLRTTDGGQTWTRVSHTAGAQDSTAGSLPFGCQKSGLVFVNADTGWATGGCPGGPIFFFVTHDAGTTWTPATLPTPLGYSEDLFTQCQCYFDAPLVNNGRILLLLRIYESPESTVLYMTEDGMSWTSVILPSFAVMGMPAFINPTDGWLTDGQQLFATHDGGQNWTPVAPFPSSELRGSLNFVNSHDGWFSNGQQLFVTHDGGQNWRAFTTMMTLPQTSGGTTSNTDTPDGENLEVTLANNNQTVTVPVGHSFLLKLGEDYTWSVDVTDDGIVSRVPNMAVVRGAQGVYEARQAGNTTLTAAGEPLCRQQTPPCGRPSILFQIHINVP
ncbi:MAG: hypothetical protein KC418_17565 [Anaerolineales bacterium]|nr:hypothetical protein [Anaerolineales bacterium]MCB8954826.1 hypothetical protein [Ardenticatenales bacterium]